MTTSDLDDELVDPREPRVDGGRCIGYGRPTSSRRPARTYEDVAA